MFASPYIPHLAATGHWCIPLNYSKACQKYNPARVITSEAIASLVGKAWPHSIRPLNILSGFKKSGISPLNSSEVSDRMLASAKALKPSHTSSSSAFSDPQYDLWLKENHPDSSDMDSMKTHIRKSVSTLSTTTTSCEGSSVLSDILAYPEPKVSTSKRKRKPALNSKAVCLSDSPVVQEMKRKRRKKRTRRKEIEKEGRAQTIAKETREGVDESRT